MSNDTTLDEMESMMDSLARLFEEQEKARELMKFLQIPQSTYTDQVSMVALYRIITDPQKCQELVSKLKMKAFW